jgi:hypothetical protein
MDDTRHRAQPFSPVKKTVGHSVGCAYFDLNLDHDDLLSVVALGKSFKYYTISTNKSRKKRSRISTEKAGQFRKTRRLRVIREREL